MIAYIHIQLEAITEGFLRKYHGRQLHGSFFKLLSDYDKELANAVHDEELKPFTLEPITVSMKGNGRKIHVGDVFDWHVTILREELIDFIGSLSRGQELVVDNIHFRIVEVFAPGTGDTLIIDEEILFDQPTPKHLQGFTIETVTPVLFRDNVSQDQRIDVTIPTGRLIIKSLVNRWNALHNGTIFDVHTMTELGERIYLTNWSGHSEEIHLNRTRGCLGGVGTFTFAIHDCSEEDAKVLQALLLFAQFVGIGRMTPQALGIVKTKLLS